MNKQMQNLMRQMQKMQEDLKKAQDNLQNIQVEGSAGGGMVKVTANCAKQILKIEIDPEVIDKDEQEMLQDLIVAATNQALENADTRAQEEMAKVAGPLANLPGGMKLPF
ncbi:MAG: YbaB/EbfC family nucleoid-associated protein [Calditrichia bacterium]